MIQAYNKGDGVQVLINSDGIIDMLEQLTAIIRGVRHHLTDNASKEFADYAIAYAGKMAYAETDEERHQHTDEFCKWMDENGMGDD